MTQNNLGMHINSSGKYVTQSLEENQRSFLWKEWSDAKWFVDGVHSGKTQPVFGEEKHTDYGKSCDMCGKANIWEKKKQIESTHHFLMMQVIHSCISCRAIKRKYFIAFNEPMGTSYIPQ